MDPIARLTLTFDNGPDPATTPTVLSTLRSRSLRATFFPVGRQLERAGGLSLLQQARDEGHWVGNHSQTHTLPLGNDPDPYVGDREIGAMQRLLGELAHPDRLFRPFGGGGHLGPHLLSDHALRYLVDGQYTVVLWNSVPHDWDDPVCWVDRALEHVERQSWTVVVLHDLATGAMDHLARFLDAVLERAVDVVQDFPDDCVPIYRGQLRGDVAALVASGSG